MPTEKTSSMAVELGEVAGWSRVSVAGVLGLRPLLRLLSPILLFGGITMSYCYFRIREIVADSYLGRNKAQKKSNSFSFGSCHLYFDFSRVNHYLGSIYIEKNK